jgi:two-component system NtrC family sensor kinase
MEARSIATEGLLHQILQAVMEGIAVENDGGQLVFANRALEQLLGCQPGELLGLHWTALFPEWLHNRPRAWRVGESGKTSDSYKASLLHRDGTLVPVLVSSCRLFLGTRELGVMSTFSALEQNQLQTQVRTLEIMAAMDWRASGVVHELNNSLAIMRLQARLLSERERLPPQVGEGLAIIRDQAERMKQMLEAMRAPADPHQPRLEIVDVNVLIQRTLHIQHHQLDSDGIEVAMDLAAELPMVQADPHQLQQVLINLVNNARQAIAASGRAGRLVVTTDSTSDAGDGVTGIQVRIADNGPGIPPYAMPRIFEPFFTTKKKGQGTGLGLAICDQIVQQHGGRMWAENNDEGGATFVLELPGSRQASVEAAPSPGVSPVRPAQTTGQHRGTKSAHILVVDDEPSVARAVRQVLCQAGFEVTIATEGEKALSLLDHNSVDLIISDWTMLRMGGLQFWQAVGERHPRLANRIIFATGDTSSRRLQAQLGNCGCAWIKKPFQVEELLRLIQEALPAEPETSPG